MTLPPHLRQAILDRAGATRSPTRAETDRRTVALALVLPMVVALVSSVVGRAREARSLPYLSANAALAFLLAAGVTAAVLWFRRSSLGFGATTRATVLLCLGLASPLVVLLVSATGEPHVGVTGHDVACFFMTLGFSVVVAASVGLGLSKSEAVSPTRAAFAIGGIGGAWGALAMVFFCPQTGALHILVSHGMGTCVAIGVAAVLLRRKLDAAAL